MLSLQDLLLGDHCCVDIMGATQFKTPRANWDKRCCSNPKGPVVELANDLSPQDAKKIDKQIERMPHLKQVLVWHALVLPFEKLFFIERFLHTISCNFFLSASGEARGLLHLAFYRFIRSHL